MGQFLTIFETKVSTLDVLTYNKQALFQNITENVRLVPRFPQDHRVTLRTATLQ